MTARYTVGMTRIASLLLLFALAACGNKGPLVLPDPASGDAAQPVAAPVVVPPTEPSPPEPATSADPAPSEPVPGTSGTPAR